jgi:hypothetical protein
MGVVWCVLRGSSPHMCVPRSPVCVQLAPSASFRFTVSVTTFLGAVATKAVEVTVASASIPLVVFDGPVTRAVPAGAPVSLVVLAEQKVCGDAGGTPPGLAYRWTLLSSAPMPGECGAPEPAHCSLCSSRTGLARGVSSHKPTWLLVPAFPPPPYPLAFAPFSHTKPHPPNPPPPPHHSPMCNLLDDYAAQG